MLDVLGKLTTRRFIANPIFIVGGGRSGTIALFKAISRHPEILVSPSEDPFVTDVGGMAYALAYADEREQRYYQRSLRISHEYIDHALRRLCLESALGPNYGLKYLAKLAVRERVNLFGKRYWCTKSFPSENVAKGLLSLYPNAKFIYILRNGLNVVHSRTKFPEFRDFPFEDHCETWASSVIRFNYLFQWPQAVAVRQEELLDDPEAVFKRIFEHIGVTYHSAPTNYARTTHVHPLADQSVMSNVDVAKVLRERPPGYKQWSEGQKAAFRRICGDAMTLAGYHVPF